MPFWVAVVRWTTLLSQRAEATTEPVGETNPLGSSPLPMTQKNTAPHGFPARNSVPSAPSGARTLDTRIKSPLLYQLS